MMILEGWVFLMGEVPLYPRASLDEANHELELFLDVACDQQTLSLSPTHSLSLILVNGCSFSYTNTPAKISQAVLHRGTSLTRKRNPLGPHCGPMPKGLRGSQMGGHFRMEEVLMYRNCSNI